MYLTQRKLLILRDHFCNFFSKNIFLRVSKKFFLKKVRGALRPAHARITKALESTHTHPKKSRFYYRRPLRP